MKLRDLYEDYQLKVKVNDIRSGGEYVIYDIGEYQVIILSMVSRYKLGIINLGISNSRKVDIYGRLVYKPNRVIGHSDIVKFVENNIDIFVEDRQKIVKTFIDIPRFGGYTDWKILDNGFKVRDGDMMELVEKESGRVGRDIIVNVVHGLYLKDGYGYFSDDVTYSKEGVYRSEYDRDSKSVLHVVGYYR